MPRFFATSLSLGLTLWLCVHSFSLLAYETVVNRQ